MSFELNIPKKWHWIIIWIEFYLEMNNWITVWVECLLVWWKSLFMSILDTFGQFSALFLICQYQEFPVYWIELPLNWISRFFRNRIIFWIELNNIESNIEWIIFWQSSRIESNQVGYRTPLRQLNMWLCHWVSESAFDCLDFVLATMTPVCTALHCTANTSMHCKYQLTLEFISRY